MVVFSIALMLSVLGTTTGSDSTQGTSPVPLASVGRLVVRYDFVVTSPAAEIDFEVTTPSADADRTVHLWTKPASAGPWQDRGRFQPGKAIPITFDQEGTYLIKLAPAAGDAGPSGQAEVPVYRCLVDWTSPVLAIKNVTYDKGHVLVQWLAYDPHLPVQCIDLHAVNEVGQMLLGRTSNSGWGKFELNEKLLPAQIKVTATDRAGNYVCAVSERILPPRRRPTPANPATQPAGPLKPKAVSPARDDSLETIHAQARWHYKIGKKYKAKDQLKLAEYHLKQAVQQAPEFIDAHLDLAGVFMSLHRYNDAVKSYLQALSVDIGSAKGWQGLGTAQVRLGRYFQAKPCFEKATTLEGKDSRSWLYLGDSCWMLGQQDQAAKNWQLARKLAVNQKLTKMVDAADERFKLLRQP